MTAIKLLILIKHQVGALPIQVHVFIYSYIYWIFLIIFYCDLDPDDNTILQLVHKQFMHNFTI